MVRINLDPMLRSGLVKSAMKTRVSLPSAMETPHVNVTRRTNGCGSYAEFCNYSLDPCGAIP